MDSVRLVQHKNLVILTLILSVASWVSGILFKIDALRITGLFLLIIPFGLILLIISKLVNRFKSFQDEVANKMKLISNTETQVRKLDESVKRDIEQFQATISIQNTIHHYLDKPRAPLPLMQGYAADPLFSLTIINQILEIRPERVLDVGSGLSTILAGYTLERINQGMVVSLEHHQDYFSQSDRQIKLHGLENYINLNYAPLKNYPIDGKNWLWYDLDGIDPDWTFDLLIIDGPPGTVQQLARYPALPLLAGRISRNARILVDDTHRADETKILKLWEAQFPEWKQENVQGGKGVVIMTLNDG